MHGIRNRLTCKVSIKLEGMNDLFILCTHNYSISTVCPILVDALDFVVYIRGLNNLYWCIITRMTKASNEVKNVKLNWADSTVINFLSLSTND